MQDLMDMNTEINEAMSRSYALPEFDESELNSGFAFSFPLLLILRRARSFGRDGHGRIRTALVSCCFAFSWNGTS